MVHFVGAGPGATDLITVRGRDLLRRADLVVYAGSLVNPELLKECKSGCQLHNSAKMTLNEVVSLLIAGERNGCEVVRLHTGEPSLYGAIREQMALLEAAGVPYDVTPGVSSFSAAAAALGAEYTLPGVSQTVILTRCAGRTPVPEGEALSALAAHGSTLVLFLSAGLSRQVQAELLAAGLDPDTPAAVVYKASWPEEQVLRCTVGTLAQTVEESGIRNTALLTVGRFLDGGGERSKLYDPGFAHGWREKKT